MGDVSEMESLYKACHANPLWSPAEKRKRKSDRKRDVEVCSKKYFEGFSFIFKQPNGYQLALSPF